MYHVKLDVQCTCMDYFQAPRKGGFKMSGAGLFQIITSFDFFSLFANLYTIHCIRNRTYNW